MKTTRLILFLLIAGTFAATTSGCKKCKGEDPRARIVNNGTVKADVQVKTSGGNTVNINGVQPGTSSEYASYASGTVTFTINAGKNTAVQTVEMSDCHDYDIAIDAANHITVTNTDRND